MKKKRKLLDVFTLNFIEIQRKIAKANERKKGFLSDKFDGNSIFRKIKINKNEFERIFYYRMTASDLGVMRQIFIAEDYSISSLQQKEKIQNHYDTIVKQGKIPLILDCGSNIGASAVWFADAFPKAQIVCFEPDPENFALLERNTKGLNVELHKAAIGSQTQNCELTDQHLGAWGLRTITNEQGDVRMIGILDFMRTKAEDLYVPFLAKIDIEGAESELFSDADQWAEAFQLIIIELHDWLLPGGRTSQPFLAFAAKHKRDFVHIGENIYSIRL